MRNLKKWTAALLAVILLLSAGMADTVFAAQHSGGVMYGTDPALVDSDFDGIPDEYDIAPDSNVFTGKLKSGHDSTTAVSYAMDFRVFFGDRTAYDSDLASASVMGAALAYYEADYSDAYFTFDTAQTWSGGTATKVNGLQLMQVLGFEDVADFSLDSYGDDDICEMLIGHRTVTFNGETRVIVAIWVRGTDSTSMEEWSSNFHMGDLVRFFDAYDSVAGKSPRQSNDDWTRKINHRGFDVCATRLLRYLKTYYLDEFVQPALEAAPGASLVYWLTGHSRGAAVSNLMASYLIDEGAAVWAYTFAAPYNTANTEASAEKYDSIFNLVNANDFIPMLPMPEWGFTRYGRTATVDASQYASQIKTATGSDYSGNYLSASDMSTLLGKFVCITGETGDRNAPGKILGWREVYVYHCGHTHEGETVGDYQSTTFVKKQSLTNWGGPSESSYNSYATRLRKYSYWHDGICETPAYDLQVLVELLVSVAKGETLGGASTYITSNKLADKFDFDKWSLISYATKLTEPHFMDTYSVIQAQINAAGSPGSLFHTLPYYTASNAPDGRPVHTHTYVYVPYEGQEPTCTEGGLGYRYCLCSTTNADYYDDYQKNVVIPATGHDWGDASYTWSEDGSEVTALRTCANDPAHVESETAAASAEVTLPATCTEPGEMTYTAVFKNPAFSTQTRVEPIEAIGHAWGEPEWSWEGFEAATATFICANDPAHVEELAAEITSETTAATPGQGGQTVYTATVTGPDGLTYTDTRVALLAPLGPQIVTQPVDVSAPNGTITSFTVEATGEGLTYQWQVNPTGSGKWVNSTVASGTTPTLKVSATTAREGYRYRCVVTDAYGNQVISDAATLHVTDGPAITTQPQDVTAGEGKIATFTVEAIGEDLTYQWQVKATGSDKWVNSTVTSGKTDTLKVSAAMVRNGYEYRCVITDANGGSTISEAAMLHVAAKPVIATQPENFIGLEGDKATFTVEAVGEGLTYQWQVMTATGTTWSNSKAPGCNTAQLTVTITDARIGQKYRCVVKDQYGNSVTSEAAVIQLPVSTGPEITGQPQDATVLDGKIGRFTVEAAGEDLTYQWQVKTTGSSKWVNSTVASGTTPTLKVAATLARNGYQYRCIVTDAEGGWTISDAATLTVLAAD